MEDGGNATLHEPEFCEILTDRLRLRTLRMSDLEHVFPIISDPNVMKWTSRKAVSSEMEARQWLSARCQGRDIFNFGIEVRGDDRSDVRAGVPLVGLAGCFHRPEVGYLIHSAHSGKGYATETLNALIPAIFERMPAANDEGTGFDHIEGWTDTDNWASRKVLEKCGFTYCETIPDPETSIWAVRYTVVYRKARPGMTLEQMGLLVAQGVEPHVSAPTPPIQ